MNLKKPFVHRLHRLNGFKNTKANHEECLADEQRDKNNPVFNLR